MKLSCSISHRNSGIYLPGRLFEENRGLCQEEIFVWARLLLPEGRGMKLFKRSSSLHFRCFFLCVLPNKIVAYRKTNHPIHCLDFYIILLFIELRVREISRCSSHILYLLLTIFNYNISLDFLNFIL